MNKYLICFLLGLILSLNIGNLLIPYFKNKKVSQRVSTLINERHIKKDGTLTMGGFIFIISTLLILFFLEITNHIKISNNIILILFAFIAYSLLGFIDDYLKIKFNNNKGISIILKFLIEIIIALIFFYFFIINGNNTYILNINLKYFYGLFILFILSGTTNAVNITDGLDGLAGGLSLMVIITLGIISLKSYDILSFREISIVCFILAGSILGFLYFNFYPAKIFMGDIGSLSLGAFIASVSIILKKELMLIVLCLIFIIETISSFIQIISIRVFKKKVFLKSPLHHHFEMLGYSETEIIKLFYLIQIMLCLITLVIYL